MEAGDGIAGPGAEGSAGGGAPAPANWRIAALFFEAPIEEASQKPPTVPIAAAAQVTIEPSTPSMTGSTFRSAKMIAKTPSAMPEKIARRQ